MAKSNAALNIIFGADTKELDKALGEVGRKLRATSEALTDVGKKLSIGLTAPIGAFAAMSGKTFVDFEFQMQKVKAVSGATAAEFARLQKQAQDLGASTVFTASEVAELQQEFAKLGFTAAEIDKVTEATLYLAQATDSDLARAAEVAGSTLRGFGLDASQTGMVTDVMAQSFNATALDLDSFAEAMKYVAPIAAAAGLSLEETTAMLGALANSGIKGSQAGTSLRKIIGDLGRTGGSVTERIDQLAASGLNLAGAEDEVGRQAQTALLVLSKSKPKLDELTGSFQKSGGAAKRMADIMNDSARGKIKAMESAIEGMQIKIGAALSPAIIKVTEKISRMATAFTNMSATTQRVVVVVGLLVAAVGPLLLLTGQLVGAYTTIRGAIAASAAAKALEAAATNTATAAQNRLNLAVLKNPYVAAATAIAVLVTAILTYKSAADKARKAKDDFDESILEQTGKVAMGSISKQAKQVNADLEKQRAIYAELRRVQEAQGARVTDNTIRQLNNTAALIDALEEQRVELAAQYQQAAALNREEERQRKVIDNSTTATENNTKATTDNTEAARQRRLEALKEAHALEMVTEEMRQLQLQQLQEPVAATRTPFQGSNLPSLDSLGLAEIELPDTEALYEEPIAGAERFVQAHLRAKTAAQGFSAAVAQAIEGASETVAIGFAEMTASAIAGGEGFAGFGEFLLGTLADLAIQVGKIAIGVGIAVEGIKAALETLNPVLAVAAGIALIAVGSVAKMALSNAAGGNNVPAFATGGMTTGPMLAMIGDNASGKEAVIPFERMGEFLDMAGASQPSNVTVTGRISGRDIMLSNERSSRDRKRIR